MKNVPCHFYHMGACQRGRRCFFSHSGKPHGICKNKDSCSIAHYEIPCPLFLKGNCKYGSKCDFRHEQKDINEEDKNGKPFPRNREVKKRRERSESSYDSRSRSRSKSKDRKKKQKSRSKSRSNSHSHSHSQSHSRSYSRQYKKEKRDSKRSEVRNESPHRNTQDKIKERERNQENKRKSSDDQQQQKQTQSQERELPPPNQQKFEDKQQQQPENVQKENFKEKLQELHQDLMIFKPFENKIMKKADLDLMFIMDCTGSMDPWIDASKKELNQIIDYVRNQFKLSKVRISYIGYRDLTDKEQYCIQEFTEDLDKVKQFIDKKADAYGGGDIPEDIAGAFEHALKQKWESKARYCVLVTDSPCHGNKYHNCEDSYPKGDPQKREPEQQIKEFAKQDIQFYAIKINKQTNKMYDILSQAYQEIAAKPIGFADLGNSTNAFGFYIACTVMKTIGASIMGTQVTAFKKAIKLLKDQKLNQVQSKIDDQLDQIMAEAEEEEKGEQENQKKKQKEMLQFKMDDHSFQQQVNSGIKYKAKAKTYFIVKDKNIKINWKKPLIQDSEITTTIIISQNPFAQGAMRYAFYAQDTYLNQKMVAKLPKWIDETYTIENMKKDLESIFICQHIVNEFNEKIITFVPDTRLLLNFVHCFIYEIEDEQSPYKYYYTENLIEGQYEKYNNNAGWCNSNVNESSLISQAFSHYSWQATSGYLLIVDLQGVTGVLTDPQIHCLDYNRLGKGNLGYEGIMKFFVTHKCNQYCKSLKLQNPNEVNELPENFDFFDDAIPYPKNPHAQVYTLCDLCRKPFKESAGTIYQKQRDSQERYCYDCDTQRRNTMKQGKCIDCDNTFRSSEFWFKMKRTDFPVRCTTCRKERREKLRMELEDKN